MRRQNTGNIRKWSGFGLVCEGTVGANDAKCAWQVVRGSGCVAEMLDDSTWSRFLDYPEHLKTWQYGMSERVLSKYESQSHNNRETAWHLFVGWRRWFSRPNRGA